MKKNNERIAKIYQYLESHKSAAVVELAEYFHVSEATIRRDMLMMEEQGMLIRHYGEVKIADSQVKEPSLSVRSLYNKEIKKKLAVFAASLIKEGDVVYIDAGTTTPLIAEVIRTKNILVVTQSISVFEILMNSETRCFVNSGYLKKTTGLIIGTETIEQVKKMKFNIAFLGGNSIHSVFGFSASDDMEAALKSAVLKNSEITYVVADSSKANKLTVPKFANLDECNLITDKLVDGLDYSKIKTVYYLDGNQFKKFIHSSV